MILRCFPSRDSAPSSECCALYRMRLVGEAKPGLALLDLMLPGAGGIELMQEIEETGQVPAIFPSPHGQDELVAGAMDLEVADYVVKPFSPAELAARIRAALSRQAAPEPVGSYLLATWSSTTPGSGSPCGPSGASDRHRAPHLGRAVPEGETGADLGAPAAAGMGCGRGSRQAAHAHGHRHPAPPAGRRRPEPRLHLHRAPRRLPDSQRETETGE